MRKKIYSISLVVLLAVFSVNSAKAACTANFNSTNVANVFNFTDASTVTSGTIITWIWNFGDLSAPGTTQNPSHTYTVCGEYVVSLTIGTSFFCTSTFTDTILVNSGMTGSFTSNVDTTTGTAAFTGSPLGLNVDYSWDFGDGNTGTGAAASNTYATSGTYYVCLTVSDTAGICSDTHCDSVVVYITPPSCSSTFTYMDNGTGNLSFQVSPLSISNTYSWDYGDGGTGTGAFSLHTYATAGTYYVCLTTTDSSTSCTSTYCDSVTAAGSACTVSYTYIDVNGIVGFSAVPPSATSTYSWDFGDGNTGTGAVTSNTYATSGNYYVCVTMNDSFNSCTVTYCDSITSTIIIGIGIKENETDEFHLSAYPNPTSDQITIAFELTKAEVMMVELQDLLGNKISENSSAFSAGKQQVVLNTEQLSRGAYLIKLSSKTANSGKLIIKN